MIAGSLTPSLQRTVPSASLFELRGLCVMPTVRFALGVLLAAISATAAEVVIDFEQATIGKPVPLQAKFPQTVSSVTLVLWGSTGCPAKLQAFDANDQLVDEASLPAAPARKAPADPVPQFELTVKAAAIATIRLSGPRTGEFLAADELRFLPAPGK
jgi:hypothetical protein